MACHVHCMFTHFPMMTIHVMRPFLYFSLKNGIYLFILLRYLKNRRLLIVRCWPASVMSVKSNFRVWEQIKTVLFVMLKRLCKNEERSYIKRYFRPWQIEKRQCRIQYNYSGIFLG